MTEAIPERLSVDDEGYDPHVGVGLVVTLDGVEQADVTGYDIPGGTVTRACRDDADRFAVDGSGNVLMLACHGRVEVTRRA